MTEKNLVECFELLADEQQALFLQHFFKTGKGQYGEGDVFWGIRVPETRKVAKAFKELPFDEIKKVLQNPVHEIRLCGLLILTEQFKKSNEEKRKKIVEFYLSNTQHINNWDLVDVSSYSILGVYLLDKPRDLLYRLAASENMWEQRIAIVSTWIFIRNDDFADTLAIAESLLCHSHDLIHKAVGWMLREVYNRDKDIIFDFIKTHYRQMPRTTLRYAIEKMPETQRKNVLQGKF
ncbi:MAG: DNA alkylation repair protein [Bacteroidales bacterium]|jgi:3-methyladenine DNA glycosylase AlkD|nr:DNA alkylation repair protein [Bacteroidales bacterium]